MAIYIIFVILQYGGKVKQIFRIGEDHGYRNNTLLFTVFTLLYAPFHCSFVTKRASPRGWLFLLAEMAPLLKKAPSGALVHICTLEICKLACKAEGLQIFAIGEYPATAANTSC